MVLPKSGSRRVLFPFLFLLAVDAGTFVTWSMGSPVAQGASINVTTTTDGGAGTLRQAIADAASGDNAQIPAGTYTLTTGVERAIGKNLSLNGAGSGDTIIQVATSSADATSRVFNITGGTVLIASVTIQNGNIDSFGGRILSSGTLTLTNSTVSGNSARFGGGIYNTGVDTAALILNNTQSAETRPPTAMGAASSTLVGP